MKIPKETAERMITGSMQEIWETFITLEGEYKDYVADYNEARYGVKCKFPIYWLWKNTNKIIIKAKNNKVLIDGNEYEEDEFETEKEERRKIMVEAILNNVLEVDITAPR